MAGGQAGGHEAAERPSERQPGHRRVAEHLVQLLELLGSHADALVGDHQLVAAAACGRRRRGPCVSGGENCVAFSSSSATRWATSLTAGPCRVAVAERAEIDALVLLDLAHRGPHDVDDLDRLRAARSGLGAGQHEQALRVAPHAGGEVVEEVEVLEHLGVLLLALELVEVLDLAVEQRLVAAGQVHVEVADALLEERRLLGGHVDGDGLHGVERLGEVAELVVGPHRDRLHRRAQVVLVVVHGVAQRVDELRQALLGEVVGGLGELAERTGDRPGGGEGQERGRAAGCCPRAAGSPGSPGSRSASTASAAARHRWPARPRPRGAPAGARRSGPASSVRLPTAAPVDDAVDGPPGGGALDRDELVAALVADERRARW